MTKLRIAPPQDIGLDPQGLQRACDLLKRWCEADQIPSAGLCIGRKGGIVEPRVFGRQRMDRDSPALRKDALFLVASITKPVAVTAVMMLIERGELTLSDKVAKFVPRFAANGKDDVQVRHLMTHSSGLPDMLPDNL